MATDQTNDTGLLEDAAEDELDEAASADEEIDPVDDGAVAVAEADPEGESEDGAAALDELEAEELEMLTEDESSEAIVVDEAAEMRAIRRAEIALEGEAATEATDDEFVCESCFLVLKSSQRARGRRKICKDCAA